MRSTSRIGFGTPHTMSCQIDKLFAELKTRAASCNFQEKDRVTRGKIVFTVTVKLQELLFLGVDGLTLKKAVKVSMAYE